MDRAENRLQPKPVTHHERELREHVACSRADDRCAKNAILARRGQNFDETAVVAVEDRAVEVGKIIARDLVSDSVFVRFLLMIPMSEIRMLLPGAKIGPKITPKTAEEAGD